MNKNKLAYLKDKLQGWPDAMALTSKDVADLIGLIESSGGRGGGHPLSAYDSQLRPAPSLGPSLHDLRGIAPNATGDLSSEEFVRRVRDGWTPPWKSAPLPAEIEEAFSTIKQNVLFAQKENIDRFYAALAVIRAAHSHQAPPLPEEAEEALTLLDEELSSLSMYRGIVGRQLNLPTEAKKALSTIRAALSKQGPQAGYCEMCKGTGEVDGPLEGQRLPCPGPKHRPAPTSGEREEMLEIIDSKISALVSRYGWLRLGDLKRNEVGNPINREYETLNKIRALLLAQPVTVTREWVEETAATLVCAKWRSIDDQNEWLSKRLREKDIAVEAK